MKTIGVRELRQRASEYLREVEQGHTLEVTARGRPVARLVPVPARSAGRRRRLIESGRLSAGRGDLLDLGGPLRPARGVSVPSRLLAAAREDER
jgi:prevent-host-death family protein